MRLRPRGCTRDVLTPFGLQPCWRWRQLRAGGSGRRCGHRVSVAPFVHASCARRLQPVPDGAALCRRCPSAGRGGAGSGAGPGARRARECGAGERGGGAGGVTSAVPPGAPQRGVFGVLRGE